MGQFEIINSHGKCLCIADIPTPEVVTVSSSKNDTVLHEQFIFTSICQVLSFPHTMCTYPPAPVRADEVQHFEVVSKSTAAIGHGFN